jgi:hypothetical protein
VRFAFRIACENEFTKLLWETAASATTGNQRGRELQSLELVNVRKQSDLTNASPAKYLTTRKTSARHDSPSTPLAGWGG